ncbi:TonB-dependent receptor plug domain-containing protein [Candidatus Neomarinimicrobiota bacterium]
MLKNVIIVLLFSTFAMADAPISGQVFSTNGNPLAYAVIADFTNQNWIIADENGQFNYHFSADIGDTLSISRYGYQTSNFVVSDRLFYTLSLIPKPIKQDDVTVSGENQNFIGQMTNTYQRNIGNDNPQSVFRQIPGITIRSYGSKAGIINLSTNGNPAINTKILFDDIDLTSAQNGETDLSQIPETLINHITIVNSPGIFYGSGAVDGVLRISPQNQQTIFSTSMGSCGFGSFSGNISKNQNKWSANLSAGYLKDDGDFKYSNQDSSEIRLNNDFERKYISLNTIGRLSDKSNLNSMLLESRQERGVAGSIDWPSPEARRNDNLQIGSLIINQLHTNGYSKVQFSHRRSLENYVDRYPIWPMESEHDVRGTVLKFQHHNNIWGNIAGTFLYERKLEKLESTDVGNRVRKTNSIASIITIPFWYNLNIILALRLDRAGSNRFQPTVDLRLSYNNLKNSEMEYHYGTGFRYPTFNDLYWQPGGNPDLTPEKSWYQIIKYKLYLNNNYLDNIYFNIGDRYTDGLIQWVPIDESSFIWQPQNIASSRRTNFTIGSQINLEDLPFQIAVHATYQKSRDIYLDKPLLYASEFIGYAGVIYLSSIFQISLNANYIGERISSYDYPYDELLPSYIQTNATIQYQLPIFGNQLLLWLDINNILDKQFESISGYPEPGRTIRLGLKYILSDK